MKQPVRFSDSQEASYRRLVRHAIRKGELTRAERDVTLVIVNQWFHHRNGPKKFIHPSREHIAAKAKVSVRTVASALSMLRAAQVLVPVSSLTGGKARATQYQVNLSALMVLCGCDWIDEFLRGLARNCTVSKPEIARYEGAAIAHCLKETVEPCDEPSQEPVTSEAQTDRPLSFSTVRKSPSQKQGLGSPVSPSWLGPFFSTVRNPVQHRSSEIPLSGWGLSSGEVE